MFIREFSCISCICGLDAVMYALQKMSGVLRVATSLGFFDRQTQEQLKNSKLLKDTNLTK
jgi:hypothetical protein